MERAEYLIDASRKATHNEDYSSTNGISQAIYIQWLNEAQSKIWAKINEGHPNFSVNTSFIDLVQAQETYTLPVDAYLGARLITVEWLWTQGTPNRYKHLKRKSIHQRDSFISGVPSYYFRAGNTLYINPIPGTNQSQGIRLVYEYRPRRLDIRRGLVSSITGGMSPTSIVLNTSPSAFKDSDLPAEGVEGLKTADYICIIDKDGVAKASNIPIDSYDPSSGTLTIHAGYSLGDGESINAGNYVTLGQYSSTHSDLPQHSICRDYLVNYMNWRALRFDSSPDADRAEKELSDTLMSVASAFDELDADIDWISFIDSERIL